MPKNWRQGIRGKNCPKKEEPVKKRKDLSGRGKAAALLLLFFALTLSSCANREAEELRLSGIELVEKGKYEEAVKKLDEALDKSHGRVSRLQFDILTYRAESEYMLGDLDAASHTLEILEKVDKKREVYQKLKERVNAKLLLRQASRSLDEGKLEEARNFLDQARAAGLSADRDLVFDEAVYLERSARWEEAYRAFTDYTNRWNGDKDAERELAFLKTRVEALSQNTLLTDQPLQRQ
ncbi:tetratricopeptide repeat protein [Oribacterium sp. oral taxon 078 str. F0262]|nr:tetratricopeptide repeat protein [Oribacterium sp. oral taxon 078 str. F0262]